MEKAIQENLKAEGQCQKAEQLFRPCAIATAPCYLTRAVLGSNTNPQSAHLVFFSNSSEKIDHSLPQAGHLIFTSLKDLLASNPGQCWLLMLPPSFPGCGLRLTRPSSDQPHFRYRLPENKLSRFKGNKTYVKLHTST
jgi:hypothetical protein